MRHKVPAGSWPSKQDQALSPGPPSVAAAVPAHAIGMSIRFATGGQHTRGRATTERHSEMVDPRLYMTHNPRYD